MGTEFIAPLKVSLNMRFSLLSMYHETVHQKEAK